MLHHRKMNIINNNDLYVIVQLNWYFGGKFSSTSSKSVCGGDSILKKTHRCLGDRNLGKSATLKSRMWKMTAALSSISDRSLVNMQLLVGAGQYLNIPLILSCTYLSLLKTCVQKSTGSKCLLAFKNEIFYLKNGKRNDITWRIASNLFKSIVFNTFLYWLHLFNSKGQ